MSVAAKPRLRGVVGDSAPRSDAPPKTQGSFLYASDLARDGMLHGATVRSPHARARVTRVDTSAARAMPGVRAVLTAADLPTRAKFGLMKLDQPVLADGIVRYVGEPVAIVAADDDEQARLAAKAVTVMYEPLPAITDPVAALQADAPKLHDDGNVIDDVRVLHGDPGVKADVVVEGEYEIGMQDQAALGPEAGLAIPDPDGGVTLHIATQWMHEDLRQITACLGLPEKKVRLILGGVGGAFGAREDVTLQIHCCLLALATRKPVRMVYVIRRASGTNTAPPKMGRSCLFARRSSSTVAATRPRVRRSSRMRRASAPDPTACRTQSSTPWVRTRTTRPPARCAASARCSRASRTRRRWTSSRRR